MLHNTFPFEWVIFRPILVFEWGTVTFLLFWVGFYYRFWQNTPKEEVKEKGSACDFLWLSFQICQKKKKITSLSQYCLFCVCTKDKIPKTYKAIICSYFFKWFQNTVLYAVGQIGRNRVTINKVISHLENADSFPICQEELINVSLPLFKMCLGSSNDSCNRCSLSWLRN